MFMQRAVGLGTGVIAAGLVYGMKKFGKLVSYRQGVYSRNEPFKSQITKWHEGLSLIVFILFILMVIVGIIAG